MATLAHMVYYVYIYDKSGKCHIHQCLRRRNTLLFAWRHGKGLYVEIFRGRRHHRWRSPDTLTGTHWDTNWCLVGTIRS